MEVKRLTALDIANLIIVYVNQMSSRGSNLTPIKLQKILYYVYVDCLVNHNIKLFDTPIEKWKFGPVVSSVYHKFKSYGVTHIESASSTFEFDEVDGEFRFTKIPFEIESLELEDKIIQAIESKVNELIEVDPFELVERTHREKPWKDFEIEISRGDKGLEYTDCEILSYFKQ